MAFASITEFFEAVERIHQLNQEISEQEMQIQQLKKQIEIRKKELLRLQAK